jgi:hypothetical protein
MSDIQRLAMIRAHALNAKRVNPDSVDADDKLFLLSLLDRIAEARSRTDKDRVGTRGDHRRGVRMTLTRYMVRFFNKLD